MEKCDSMVSKDWDKLFFIILSLSSEGGDDDDTDEVVLEWNATDSSSSATGLILYMLESLYLDFFFCIDLGCSGVAVVLEDDAHLIGFS